MEGYFRFFWFILVSMSVRVGPGPRIQGPGSRALDPGPWIQGFFVPDAPAEPLQDGARQLSKRQLRAPVPPPRREATAGLAEKTEVHLRSLSQTVAHLSSAGHRV